MVNLAICAKCPKCLGYEASRVDEAGAVVALPVANCALAGPLLGDSELPEHCVFAAEQVVTEDDAFDAHESYMNDMRCVICSER